MKLIKLRTLPLIFVIMLDLLFYKNKCCYVFFRSPYELMNWLKPLFILDTKIQRSFMACIKLDDLETTLVEENISLEIKLATMQHYFEICKNDSQVLYTFFDLLFILSHKIEKSFEFFYQIPKSQKSKFSIFIQCDI